MSFYGNIYADPQLKFELTPSRDSEDDGTIYYDLVLKTPNGVEVAKTKIILPTDNVVQKVMCSIPSSNSESLTLKFYIKDLDSSETAQELSIPFKNMITTDSLKDNAVTTSKISNGAVTTEKIVDQNITTEKMKDNAITWDKLNDTVRNKIATYQYDPESCILSLKTIEEVLVNNG